MIGVTLAWLGAATALGLLSAYFAYTLFEWTALRRLLMARRPLMAVVAALCLAGAALEPGLATAASAAVAASCAGYMFRRQWLVPRPAPSAEPCDAAMDDAALVAVLPDGAAVPLAWLTRARTVQWADLWVVHCALARTLAVFDREGEPPVAAVLPNPAGFDIASRGRAWDGATGRALGPHPDLRGRPVALATYARWSASNLGAPLLGPPNGAPLPAEKHIVPRVPGARGVTDPMAWGRVEGGRWRQLDVTAAPGVPATRVGWFVARWAARHRGVPSVTGSESPPLTRDAAPLS